MQQVRKVALFYENQLKNHKQKYRKKKLTVVERNILVS
jgi:hypothetical protein